MSRRTLAFAVFAIAISLGCIRLGVWQLSRLRERRSRNAVVASRLDAEPVSLGAALRDSATARYRRILLSGRWDYANEHFVTTRSRNGSPGIHLITPLRLAGADSAVLVLRGWIYAPDGMTVDLGKWHEGDSVTIAGFVDAFTPGNAPVASTMSPRAVRRLDLDSLRARIPYPIASALVVQTSDSLERDERPARLAPPPLDDGPHQSYAIQWFAFALIGFVGVGIVLRKELQGP